MAYDVAAYIWPAYTGDEPRTRVFWPEGMGEWQTVKAAAAKFPGHEWPRKPLWGYVNEADPCVMEMEIGAAADHGVNVFIYDWYWYDRRPFLENCLNDGFLKAKNNGRMRFYLMWANHDASNLWDKRLSHDLDTVIWDAGVDMKEFRKLASRVIGKYFTRDNYYKIDGKPVFSIYDIPKLTRGFGGIDQTREALDWFREEAVRQGLPGLHLQFIMWNERSTKLSGAGGAKEVPASGIGPALGFDSFTHYQFVHFTDIDRTYPEILRDARSEWDRLDKAFGATYFPHVSVGWDTNPRFTQLRPGVMKETTPANIEEAFRAAKAFADSRPDRPPLITVNSWNEWTETSYLEPDDRNGYGFLDAVKRVFCR
ncbi:MAG: glycoside hydrolase family 99-like domain-containing protein [Oscillospiraceae bacterium]|jgi:hypothetical protein|nr:glycoside hydrolase family 99-like domain-containing protein [Oscillospiraceae bacterium]